MNAVVEDDFVVTARGLRKRYGSLQALDGIDLSIPKGRIVGLIGRNGAGKTTALKAMLGLTSFDGQLNVLGHDPFREREQLMQDVTYVADVAVLPKWMRVSQAIDFVAHCHPRFSIDTAMAALAKTDIKQRSKIKGLSKGMIVQLHLALVMAIDARFLVLDEPTLGLDIVYRKMFYQSLLNDYFDGTRTILVTTHQVEEIEHIVTDVVFIDRGRIVFNESVESLDEKYVEVLAAKDQLDAARHRHPLSERREFGQTVFLFERDGRQTLESLGEMRRPRLADLFVAKVAGGMQ
jgi:ABC-2 type transport system ATP-binding protein